MASTTIFVAPAAPRARLTYLALSAIVRRQLLLSIASTRRHSSSSSSSDNYQRSDFTNQPYTSFYEPGGPTEGPLRDAYTPPRITPTILKQHLDQFVVGQERAKRTLATAVYNHYQRIQELQRRDEEGEELRAQDDRRRMNVHPRHPVEGRESELRPGIVVPSLMRAWDRPEDEFPGQIPTNNAWDSREPRARWQSRDADTAQKSPLFDPTPLTVEKSNILLLGPSGVGKTLMAKTLARVLDVPFSMSDCTPFTQAGYIGEDADVCVQRLLAAANYDVARAERGIICLDEIDKIATARVSHGKDVSGEGVQQALLKIIEGTTLQIQSKSERSSAPPNVSRSSQSYSPHSPLSGGGSGQQSSGGGQKGETYNVKTDDILFICAGAFNGLHKIVLDRVSAGSFGFGATVRARPGTPKNDTQHETMLEGEDELFEKYLPYYSAPAPAPSTRPNSNPNAHATSKTQKRLLNTLDLIEPQDLQKYGLIPELVGRIPISCALSALSVDSLVQVLTEPRNSLLRQYEQQFHLSSVELRVTSGALRAIATSAAKMGTGARALRTVMERLLADAMFELPGSGIKHLLVTEEVALKKAAPFYFPRGQQARFHAMIAADEDAFEERRRREESERNRGEHEEDVFERRGRVNREGPGGVARTFEEYRVKQTAAGS